MRFVGGCLRKILSGEEIDDIDLATNLEPSQVCEILSKNKIQFYESGIEHGTVTAKIKNTKFEITTLRKDLITDGRHATVGFSKNWYDDASRRDFTINSIYSDLDGNILMTRLMRPGETYVVPNINGLTFNTGNAGALSLSQGDVIVSKLGEVGEIITAQPLNIKTFSKKQLLD